MLSFPSPKPEKVSFTKYWDAFIPDIAERENLKNSHLQQLRILCDLSVEYDELQEILDIEGRTYESVGRNGTQIKMRPEVSQMKTVTAEIRTYSKLLDLVLMKDDVMTNSKGDAENEFA